MCTSSVSPVCPQRAVTSLRLASSNLLPLKPRQERVSVGLRTTQPGFKETWETAQLPSARRNEGADILLAEVFKRFVPQPPGSSVQKSLPPKGLCWIGEPKVHGFQQAGHPCHLPLRRLYYNLTANVGGSRPHRVAELFQCTFPHVERDTRQTLTKPSCKAGDSELTCIPTITQYYWLQTGVYLMAAVVQVDLPSCEAMPSTPRVPRVPKVAEEPELLSVLDLLVTDGPRWPRSIHRAMLKRPRMLVGKGKVALSQLHPSGGYLGPGHPPFRRPHHHHQFQHPVVQGTSWSAPYLGWGSALHRAGVRLRSSS